MIDLYAALVFILGSAILIWNVIEYLHHSIDGLMDGESLRLSTFIGIGLIVLGIVLQLNT